MNKADRIAQYEAFMPKPFYITAGVLDNLGFFTAPASVKFHGAYEGGLFDHSFMVAKYLVELTERLDLPWKRKGSPYLVGMFHDFCKCGFYIKEDEGYRFNEDLIIPGHGDRSVIMLSKYTRLTDEEVACIRWHMGAYETDTKLWNYYGRAVTAYPNVLFTHTADMFASKVIGV